jgi:hypothetical protein
MEQFSCSSLLFLVERMDFGGATKASSTERLPPPEVALRIVQFFVIKRVNPEEVRPFDCSSTQKDIQNCMEEGWLSAQGSMPSGAGEEHVEFFLTKHSACRLSSVSPQINLPALGAVGVRSFRLDAPVQKKSKHGPSKDEWKPITGCYQVGNRRGWQNFRLPNAMDVKRVRLVCLENRSRQLQMSIAGGFPRAPIGSHHLEHVGFSAIRFT